MSRPPAHASPAAPPRRITVLAVLAGVALVTAPTASPSDPPDPGRWERASVTPVPLEYFQGLTADPYGNLYFDGIFTGVFRAQPVASPAPSASQWLTIETGRNDHVIPPEVTAVEGYEHIGDLAWAPTRAGGEPATAELLGDSGRLLVPLECYAGPMGADSQVCPDGEPADRLSPIPDDPLLPSTGAIGVVDAKTLLWRYYVKLDGGALGKAMWAALSPNGKLLWTQGRTVTEADGTKRADLLGFPVSGIAEENATEPGVDGPKLEPKVSLRGAVPTRWDQQAREHVPVQITGATFFDGRLYVAAQSPADGEGGSSLFRLWSLDVDACELLTGCDRRLEVAQRLVGESEGLATACAFGGVLHWLVAPYNDARQAPTFWSDPYRHVGQSTVMSFRPADGTGVRRVCGA